MPKPAYIMSERHLSGYRVILGFNTLTEANEAHSALADGALERREDKSPPQLSRGWEQTYRVRPGGPIAKGVSLTTDPGNGFLRPAEANELRIAVAGEDLEMTLAVIRDGKAFDAPALSSQTPAEGDKSRDEPNPVLSEETVGLGEEEMIARIVDPKGWSRYDAQYTLAQKILQDDDMALVAAKANAAMYVNESLAKARLILSALPVAPDRT